MRYMLLAVLASMCFGLIGTAIVRAEEEKDNHIKVTGVLIDQMCAEKMMKKDDPQTAAMSHEKACCEKCGKDGGMAVISGKKMFKLDDEGKAKAMAYLEKNDNMNVVVHGEEKDGMLMVKSIEADKEKAKEGEKKE